MKRHPLVIAAVLGALVASLSQTGWTQFKSAEYRYTAFAPPGWQPLIPNSHSFPVINFPQSERVEGAVLPESGAIIEVGPGGGTAKTVRDLYLKELPEGTVPTMDQTLLVPAPDPDACRTLREVGWDVNLGDADHPVFEHSTSFYCELHNRVFVVRVEYYHGNKDAKTLDALALTVARTLRISK